MASDSPHASRKVVVHLRATGDAPILKQAKFKDEVGQSQLTSVTVYGIKYYELLSFIGLMCSILNFQIAGTDKFAKVIDFLRRQLHRETLFVYVNSAFSPNPDELVVDLYNNFGFDGKLVVNYACSMAWG
ncbi:hypothetical protein RJ639_036667 [Escallonia herrerae]|uniref:Ubiquitin-like protein ATG12 n=1 Tax=Escallonia herrerae TaxID=1293975 RepID=A0AA89B609_9ASTE|nr:hypothetical protein RJ639_036667 [Escallonia herrerae]